jgi:uncharacterized protein (DUF1330 family)
MQTVAQKEVEQEKQRKGAKVLSEEKRKLVCENRQNTINNKLVAFNQAADKHLTKLNETFAKVQAYQAAHNLSVANYAELVTTATEKQQAATTAVAALKTVAVNVDCTNPETVVKLATVRDAAKTARTALHDYRMAIKAIVVALAQAQDGASSDDASSSTDGGTQ